ncbi:MAG: hypothetical protein AB7K52_10580 [Phycisphaerales bacterium]
MSGVLCHIQRDGAGAAITGLLMADRREVRSWSPGSTSTEPEARRQGVEAAARWIASQLAGAGKRRPLILSVDLDGSRCGWLTAPSADHDVVKAAARAAALSSGDEAGGGPGLGVIWSSEHGDPGVDLCVQGLSDDEAAPAVDANGTRRLFSRSSAPGTGTLPLGKHRLAVLAMPDACVRVLLDELDRAGVEVAGVISLWHALAQAWDPSRADAVSGGALKRPARAQEVAITEPVSAIVAIDPEGRLCWSWSRAGRLLAAGSQRLRRLEVARGPDAPPQAATPPGTRLRPENAVVEVSSADSGRLVSDWLAWSAQLGVAPARIVCLGPGDVVATGLPAGTGLAALGQVLASAWPGAHAAAIEDNDPVASTMLRLAGAEEDDHADERLAPAPAQLVDLSSRPGRMNRSMHWWLAAAGLAGACVLGALAWRVDNAARAVDLAATAERGVRTEILKQVESAFPNITRDPDPGRVLAAGLTQLRKTREDKTPERPIAAALERLISTAQDVPNLKLKKFTISSINLTIDFVVPDAEPGGVLLQRLRERGALTSTVDINWEGSTTTTTVSVPGDPEPKRLYKLRGFWQDIKPAPRGAPAAPAPGGTSS